MFIVLPGVFHPRSDTRLLARTACTQPLPAGARVLELCAGPAYAGLAAARAFKGALTTVDVSRRAALNASLNARLSRIRIRAHRGDLLAPVAGQRFDLIVANPPYIPGDEPPARGPGRAWEAGADGRAVLDRICADAPAHLAPGGVLLLVHSEVCGPEATLAAYAAAGLEADVAARERGPLGPILRDRRAELEDRGLLASGQAEEEVLVLRGMAPGRAGKDGGT
ncbi:methyltransferase [Candidatus Solirubrobacter pratensis]|uniref:methyltransferase n=1 Tax=Candidatus Solirubrobacter pratensis TaxID=1298857 RepID=UPI00041BCB82|nr:methyltransferase [Candidatus Solirubrobacter pratensis]